MKEKQKTTINCKRNVPIVRVPMKYVGKGYKNCLVTSYGQNIIFNKGSYTEHSDLFISFFFSTGWCFFFAVCFFY